MQNKISEQQHIAPNLMAELQTIIIGLEPVDLARLQAWLKNRTNFAEEIGHILPLSVRKAIETDDQLAKSLEPIIEPLINRHITNNPKSISDALFPFLGPMIRKSISETFRKMLESLNNTLENQFSLKRLKWRFEALTSSHSYAEIVMLRGLPFKVKQVFLIHKKTGLLIQEASADSEKTDSSDMISSMLMAVQDFIKDSFSDSVNTDDTVEAIRLNNLNVWIENSPYAILAVIFEGTPPEGIRNTFKENLEKIHLNFITELKNFNGEVFEFPLIQTSLEKCLIEQKKETSYKKLIIIASCIAILLIILIVFNVIQNYRLNNLANALNSQAGIVVTQKDKSFFNFYVKGLRDINSVNPNKIAKQEGIDSSKVHYQWKDYISTDKNILLNRFIRVLHPPRTINYRFKSNTLIISGKASHYWIITAKKFFNNNPFFPNVNMQNIEDINIAEINRLKQNLISISFNFMRGTKELSEKNKIQLKEVATLFKQILKILPTAQLKVIISLDNVDDPVINKNYAKIRLQYIKTFFQSENIKNVNYVREKYISNLKPRTIIFELTEQ